MAERPVRVRNANDPEQVSRAKLADKLDRDQQLNDMRVIMGTVEGRRVMWRLLAHTRVFKSIFVTSSEIYYKAGQQDIGHYLQEEMDEAAPELYLLMQREAAKLDATKVSPPQTTEVDS